MSDQSDPTAVAADGDPSTMASEKALREREARPLKMASVIGMLLVTALNVGCLLFVGFHFASHPDVPNHAQTIELRHGNVSLEPASGRLLAIASQTAWERPHQRQTEDLPTRPRRSPEPTDTSLPVAADEPAAPSPAEPAELAESDVALAEQDRQWVQLGALSDMTTANRYWLKLRKQHATLLGDLRSKIFEPGMVGGRLFHLRVGPLAAAEASGLCRQLDDAGADCFCVAAGETEIEQSKLDATQTEQKSALGVN